MGEPAQLSREVVESVSEVQESELPRRSGMAIRANGKYDEKTWCLDGVEGENSRLTTGLLKNP